MSMQQKSKRRKGPGSFDGDRGPKTKKGYLDENTMTYYRRVADTLSQFQDKNDEEKSTFLNNAFSNLSEEATRVAQNQTVSTIMESLIAVASPSNMRVLFVATASDLTVAFLDRFASHVFERLIQKLPSFFCKPSLEAEDEEEDDVSQEVFLESFESVCQFVESHFETLTTHVYGSHVLRAVLEALSGVSVAHELKKSQKSGYGRHFKGKDQLPEVNTKDLPKEFKPLFDKYAQKLFKICDYEVHLKDSYFSLLLQAVLMMWHKTDPALCHKHCKKIINRVTQIFSAAESGRPQDCIPDTAQDTVGSHLLEVIFKLSTGETLREVHETLLKGKLLYYAIHPVANYVLQSFIAAVNENDVVEQILDEMLKNLEDVLAVGHLGLVTCMAGACQRMNLKQDHFTETLMEAFHCKEPEERQKCMAKLLASLTTYEVFFNIDEETGKPKQNSEARLKGPINIHGSLLLQQLLQFEKPRHAAASLAGCEPQELQLLCCDPSGSHVVDVFFSSPSVIDKHKDSFLKKMKGFLVETACNRNGSRCLESIWKNLNVKQRSKVAEELAGSDRLRGDRFGHFLFYNFNLGLFSGDRQGWSERQGVESKKKRMMRELLHGKDKKTKKRKGNMPDLSDQEEKEEESEVDGVTAMFLKIKKDNPADQRTQRADDNQDSSPLAENASPKKKKRKNEKESAATEEDCDRTETSKKQNQKKKKKGKALPSTE